MNSSTIYLPTSPGITTGDSISDFRVAHSPQAQNTPLRRHFINRDPVHTAFPYSNLTPIMNMPPVEGMVDLPTLGKIVDVLSTSEDPDDKNLAAWIKEHYLPDDFSGGIEGGCPIKGSNGFAKLYSAYKRVRALTNRAQDKWPFFDRRWKRMTTAQVTQMAMDKDTMPPCGAIAKNSLEHSSMHNPAGNTDPTTQAVAGSELRAISTTALEQAAMKHPTEDPALGSTASKVTQKPHASAAKLGFSTTSIRQSPSGLRPEDNNVTVEELEACMVHRDKQKPAASLNNLTESDKIANNMSAASTPRSVLAAEADPEHSNLDDLPTASGQKRKREHPAINANRISARGHDNLRKSPRRGKGGRGRQNKSFVIAHADLDRNGDDNTPSTFGDIVSHANTEPETVNAAVEKTKPSPLSPRVTRRQKRLSGGSHGQTTSAQASYINATSQQASTQKHRADSALTAGDERNNAASRAIEDTTIPDSDSATTDSPDTDLLSLGMSHSIGPTSFAAAFRQTDKNIGELEDTMQPKEQSSEQFKLQNLGAVKYFAQVSMGDVSVDVSLGGTYICDDKKLKSDLLEYTVWVGKNGAKSKGITFETWSSIYSLGR